jgi:hypothetical protein
MNAHCFILYSTTRWPGLALTHLDDAVAGLGMTVTTKTGSLSVTWNDGPKFKVSLAAGPQVLADCAEIAEAFGEGRADRAQVAACDGWVSLSFELEKAVDEANTLIELQLTYQSLVEGWVFTQWNGRLVGPKDAA